MEVPEVHALQAITWQLFGTLTFKSERLSQTKRLRMWFALARRVAKWNRVHFLELLWCLRIERGEIFERLHMHFLIAGLPAYSLTESKNLSIMNQWERFGGGNARVRLYDPSLAGGEYTLKCLGVTDPGSAYESGKFSEVTSELMLSKSVWRVALSSKRRTRNDLISLMAKRALAS